MSTPPTQFNSGQLLRHYYSSPPNANTQTASTTTKAVDTASNAASTMSLVTDALMKKGTPRMFAQVFFAKMGMFTNAYSAVNAWNKGDRTEGAVSFIRAAASLGTAPVYNIVDGLANARETYNHCEAGNYQEAMISGAKVTVNVLGFVAPQVAIAARAAQIGHEIVKQSL